MKKPSWSIPLFRFAGIQVYLHLSWFLVAIWGVSTFVHGAVTVPIAVLLYLSLFAIVLLHEFGHSLACRQVGGKTHDIVLWPLGGIAFVSPPPRAGAVLWSIAAGPLVNVVLVPVLYLIYRLGGHLGWYEAAPWLLVYLIKLQQTNLGLLIFNVIPIYPLDGGQILQSLLWFPFGRIRSLQIAAVTGLIGVAAFAVYAVLRGDLWLGFVAFFLGQRCWLGLQEAKVLRTLERMPRHTGFACPTCHAAPPGGPLWLCRSCGGRFDPFSTHAICPHCSTVQPTTVCVNCGTAHPIDAWRTAPEPPPL